MKYAVSSQVSTYIFIDIYRENLKLVIGKKSLKDIKRSNKSKDDTKIVEISEFCDNKNGD